MLRQLIKDGLIADGEVDERSIVDVRPDDVRGFIRAHWFAGIGGWEVALRLANYKDEGMVTWTGSCPCQPFSTAGKQKGKDDERHLWPIWFNLIRECRPDVLLGEQVASSISHGWLDGVHTDLARQNYEVRAAILPAASVDAPHKRDRLWFVADAGQQPSRGTSEGFSGERLNSEAQGQRPVAGDRFADSGIGGTLADCQRIGQQGQRQVGESLHTAEGGIGQADQLIHDSTGFWSDHDWIICGDGKARRIPSIKCDVHRISDGLQPRSPYEYADSYAIVSTEKIQGRAALLHGLGNAIVPTVAARFIKACM